MITSTILFTHFRYLPEWALQNPILYIEEFCFTRTEIELFRADLLELFKAACTNIHARKNRYYLNPSNYVYSHKQAIEIVEILWILAQEKHPDYQLKDSHILFQKNQWRMQGLDTAQRLSSPITSHYRQLSNEEINNLSIFLNDLFSYKNLDEWRNTFDDILYHAHSEEIFGQESDDYAEIIPIMEYLEKIAESIFLIAELKILKEDTSQDTLSKLLTHLEFYSDYFQVPESLL